MPDYGRSPGRRAAPGRRADRRPEFRAAAAAARWMALNCCCLQQRHWRRRHWRQRQAAPPGPPFEPHLQVAAAMRPGCSVRAAGDWALQSAVAKPLQVLAAPALMYMRVRIAAVSWRSAWRLPLDGRRERAVLSSHSSLLSRTDRLIVDQGCSYAGALQSGPPTQGHITWLRRHQAPLSPPAALRVEAGVPVLRLSISFDAPGAQPS